jgi:hypothetical protein
VDTIKRTQHSPSIVGRVLLVLGFVLFASIDKSAAATQIYRCLDKNLGLLYTDEPCKDGEAMTIRAGDADPVAVARLERARDALDQSAAQRIADQRRAAAERDLAVLYGGQGPLGPDGDIADNTSYAPYDYGLPWFGPGFAGFGRSHPMRPRPFKPLQARHVAVKSTPMTPRR